MNIKTKIEDMIIDGTLSNEDLVQIIELCGGYLNLQTIPNYARTYGKSYNGVKKCRRIWNFFGAKFVIDNY